MVMVGSSIRRREVALVGVSLVAIVVVISLVSIIFVIGVVVDDVSTVARRLLCVI